MDKNEKLRILKGLNEKTLTEQYLIPLLSAGMKYKTVRYNHGILEFGRDIICYTEDEFGHPVYIGVQVKAAKITNRSIDTMCRQITEALGSPFTDLGDGKKKDMDKIILITSHEFRGKAKESLWSSLIGASPHIKRVVTCIDGSELVDLLDKHLPSVFWEKYGFFSKYFHAMKREFETIKDVSAIGQREPISLEEIYVSLKLHERKKYVLHEREIDEEIKIGPEKDSQFLMEKRHEKERIFDADDIIKKFDKVVIVGAPGSGKTTLLKHLALKSCKENLEKQERITVPVLITLKQFLDSGKNLRGYMDDVFAQFDFPEAKDFIEEDMKEGKCLILLDGFDEVVSVEKQMEVTRKIEELTRKYHKNKFIVTSRTAGYHEELKEFQELQVKEFDDQQIEKFVTNWFGNMNPEKARSVNKTIKENDRIRDLARNPLMIAIIAIIQEEDRELPQRRAELYQRCVEVLLDRWDYQRRIRNKYDTKAKEKILRRLALETHILGKESFTKKEILEKFSEYIPEVKIGKDEAEDVLKEIVERNALLKEIAIGVYEFLHLSFQEYLAALELWEKRDYQKLLHNLYEPWWEEVVLLFAGFDRDATDLVLKIQEKEKEDEQFAEDIFHSNLMLLGKCIADADYTDVRVKEKIVNDLWLLCKTGKYPFLRERAMNILALIKPDSIIDSLIENLGDENSYVREWAAFALGNIGSEKAVDPLMKALTDEDSDVRRKAVDALGKIGSEKAVDPLIRLLADEDGIVRWRAAVALGKIGSEEAQYQLIRLLADEDSYVRWRAAEALGNIGSEKAVDQLIKLLADKESYVRGWAAFALGEMGREKAVDQLIKLLADKESYVRGWAAFALGEMGREKAVDQLIKLLADKESYVRGWAAFALGEMGREKAVDQLIKLLADKESYVRGWAAFALGKMGSEKAVDQLIKLLADEDSDVRWRAAIALGKMGSEKAVDQLIKLLADEDSDVRWRAAIALGKMGSEKAVDQLIKLLADEDSDVRGWAAFALEEISWKLKKRIITKNKESVKVISLKSIPIK